MARHRVIRYLSGRTGSLVGDHGISPSQLVDRVARALNSTITVNDAGKEPEIPREVRVTHVVFDLHGGGLESLIAALVQSLADTPIRSSVITLGGRAGRIGESLRPHLSDLRVLQPMRGISMIAPLGLVRALRDLRPDVVHLHSGAWFKPALGARLAAVPAVVYTEHGRVHYDPWTLRQLDRIASHWTSRVVAVSDTLAGYLRRVVGVPEQRIRVIENGVDVNRFSPGPASAAVRERLGLPGGALVLGALGRLEPVKGYDRLLRAFRELRASEPPGTPRFLVIVGEGSEREPLQSLAAELGVQDRVRFPGWADEPVELYRLFDVFAVSSRSEGLSLSLLEAMACGVPPVVTDVGANRLVLGDALGALVHRDDAWPAFTASIESLFADPARRIRLGEVAVQRVGERFSLSRVVAQYRGLYEELADGARPGPRGSRPSAAESGRWVA